MAYGSKRNVTNTTDNDIRIYGLGPTLSGSETRDLAEYYSYEKIARCDHLLQLVASGTLTFDDGISDYGIADSLRILANLEVQPEVDSEGSMEVKIHGNPQSYDGRIVVHGTPRPRSPWTVTHFTGRSDDTDNTCRGHGKYFLLTVSGNSRSDRDFEFLTDGKIFMRAGAFGWENAPWGATMCACAMAGATPLYTAPSGNLYSVNEYNQIYYDTAGSGSYSFAGNPVPVPAVDYNYNPIGFWDVSEDGLSISPNISGTGGYHLYTVEVEASRFVNHMPIYGTCYSMNYLASDDIEYFPPGYFLRVHVHPPEEVEYDYFRVWGYFFCYREYTVAGPSCIED